MIEGYVPNTALETILSRHTFQSQGTRDVLDALKQFTKEGRARARARANPNP